MPQPKKKARTRALSETMFYSANHMCLNRGLRCIISMHAATRLADVASIPAYQYCLPGNTPVAPHPGDLMANELSELSKISTAWAQCSLAEAEAFVLLKRFLVVAVCCFPFLLCGQSAMAND